MPASVEAEEGRESEGEGELEVEVRGGRGGYPMARITQKLLRVAFTKVSGSGRARA